MRLPDPAPAIAVLIACYNEEKTIASVVRAFRQALPAAAIYVYDNNSTDQTRQLAAQAGAMVRGERRQGKGHVLRRMFADIASDVYIVVDGDDTYDASAAPAMVELLDREGLAMVVGRRVPTSAGAYRSGHNLGNKLFTGAVGWIFGHSFTDILSGYRVLSRRFVKSFPAFGGGFEIETELSVHALTLALPVMEVDTAYRPRAEGSASKLRTCRDGLRILRTILHLVRNERPFAFFGLIGAALILSALVLVYPIVVTFLETGLVPRFPTAILATGMVLSGLLSVSCGLVLDTVTEGRREAKALAYLAAGRG